MSFGYVPVFADSARVEFQALDAWLQEELLDEVEMILESVPAPTVAQRLDSLLTVHEAVRERDGVEHQLFIRTRLEVESRRLIINRVGHVTKPL